MLNISKFSSPRRKWPITIKVIFCITLLAFVFLSLFCTSFGTVMDGHSSGASCHLMGSTSADCPLSISHHMDKWLNTFAGLPKSDIFPSILFLFMIFFAWTFFRRELACSLGPPKLLDHYQKTSHFDHKGRDHIIKAFSAGIIHPQIYHALS